MTKRAKQKSKRRGRRKLCTAPAECPLDDAGLQRIIDAVEPRFTPKILKASNRAGGFPHDFEAEMAATQEQKIALAARESLKEDLFSAHTRVIGLQQWGSDKAVRDRWKRFQLIREAATMLRKSMVDDEWKTFPRLQDLMKATPTFPSIESKSFAELPALLECVEAAATAEQDNLTGRNDDRIIERLPPDLSQKLKVNARAGKLLAAARLPTSTAEWLIERKLPLIYEKHFLAGGEGAKRARHRFIRAALDELKITNAGTPYSDRTIQLALEAHQKDWQQPRRKI